MSLDSHVHPNHSFPLTVCDDPTHRVSLEIKLNVHVLALMCEDVAIIHIQFIPKVAVIDIIMGDSQSVRNCRSCWSWHCQMLK